MLMRYNIENKFLSSLMFCSPPILYLALAVIYFGKTGSWTQWDFGDGGDGPIFAWFMNWWSFAISHGLNLFVTKSVWFPNGFNLTWATSVPSAALIGLPFTLIRGPVFAFNVLTITAPALAAWTCFLLGRNLTGDWLASLVGGYIFGFSSYELGQMLGHLNLDEIFLIPLMLLVCVKRFKEQIGGGLFVVLFAPLTVLQLGFSTEVSATFYTVGAITWTVFLICGPHAGRIRLLILAADIFLSGLVTLVLASPFLIYLIKGLPDVPQVINSAVAASADLTNFFIPTDITRLGSEIFFSVSHRFSSSSCEAGAYLGLPLIILIFLAMKDNLGKRYFRSLVIVTGIIILLSLGPRLQIAGIQTGLALPWAVISEVPVIGYALPVRLTMYVALCAAIITTFYLAQVNTLRRQAGQFLLGGIVCLFLVPNLSNLGWSRWSREPFFTNENITKILGPSANVMIIPLPPASRAMDWQLNAGMQFTQSGGYVGFMPRSEAHWSSIIWELVSNSASQDFGNELSAFCASHGVEYLILTPATSHSIKVAIGMLSWHQKLDHGMDVVQVPPKSALHYFDVKGDYWPSPSLFNWVGRQVVVTTRGEPAVVTFKGLASPQPVNITATSGTVKKVFEINQMNEIRLQVPAGSTMTFTADHTANPDELYHSGDTRNLSVTLAIESPKA